MITGWFTSVTVPLTVEENSDLIIKVSFYANNPDGSIFNPWKTFLIADAPVMGRFELDAARRWSTETDTGIKTYNLGKVPSGVSTIIVSLFIFATEDSNYDWDWSAYQAWLQGYSVPFTHLDSNYKSVSVLTAPEEPPEEYEELEIDIVGNGRVTLSPHPSYSRDNLHFYPYGTVVTVFAIPDAGYEFEKWSDEIVGGVSYENPATVKPMTEHRAVKAHFREVEVPPECTIDTDCPIGYVCQNGVCVPEEPPPDEEEPERKFPWLPVALLGGGAALIIVSAKPKKK